MMSLSQQAELSKKALNESVARLKVCLLCSESYIKTELYLFKSIIGLHYCIG